MRCKNPKCKSKRMKNNYIKVIKNGIIEYFCSQKCFDDFNGVEFRWNVSKIDSYIKWSEIYAGGW